MALHVVLLLIIGGYWGFTFVLSRIVMSTGADPFAVSFWQSAIGGVLVWAGMWAVGRLPRVDGRFIRFSLVVGVLGGAAPSVLLFAAAAHVEAGVLAVCMATVPLLQFGLSAMLRVEPFRALRMAGLVLGLISVWIIASPDTGAAPFLWVFLALLAAVCYTAEEMFIAIRRPPDLNPASVFGGMIVASAVFTAPVAFTSGAGFAFSFTTPGIAELSFVLLVVGGPVAYGGFVYLIMRAGPVFAAQVSYIVTASGVIAGVVLLDESYKAGFWAAMVLMIAALALGLPKWRSAGAG